ncbi:Fe-S cluster assembly protein SufD [Polaromonas sp. JS666]|uniref:Fe-S cluster assembly protein SufD n=1 Tax=Polaromonas sp. (strain JS666 / ATCC BAA-500) TaxID=296591 RepID=UPI00004644EA|nr:Fe-S cluster assembly protein SufD [Polaromonas sp. JS666]ABE46163.1 Iron-regulated ABC transporter permease protein SufD [Polaromonas sp. JS666]
MNVTATDFYRDEFARLKASLPGGHLPWLRRAREAGLASFADTGLPTLRQEDWKYTSVAAIEKGRFVLATLTPPTPNGVTAQQIEDWSLPDTQRLVFVNGHYQPRWSRIAPLPAGVTLASLAELLERDPECLESLLGPTPHAYPSGCYPSAFAALNAAFMSDGAYVHLAAGVALDTPIHLLFVTTEAGLAVQTRNLVVADAGSRASLIEHHVAVGEGAYFTNVITDLVAGRDAEIEHHKLQQESLKAFHVAAVNADQQHGSRFTSRSFALGAVLARIDIGVGLNAEHTTCALDGLYMTDGRQHIDHHTRIDHARPHGTSREFYKGVLAGASRAVFNGKVIVHADAQHSDADQTNRNLLLSDNAEVDTKPQLEIYADDVKCSHGATVGQLDPEQIFYLRSRGVDDASARALLTFAFAEEVVDRVGIAPLRARLEKLLLGRLPERVKELL